MYAQILFIGSAPGHDSIKNFSEHIKAMLIFKHCDWLL